MLRNSWYELVIDSRAAEVPIGPPRLASAPESLPGPLLPTLLLLDVTPLFVPPVVALPGIIEGSRI